MRRRFLTALLVAVGVAVLVAPSTMTAKAPPPSGTFTLSVGSTITFTNMHLNSQHRVMAMYCMGTGPSPQGWDCRILGDNGSSIGEDMTLPDTSFTYPETWQPWLTPSTPARLVLADADEEVAYFSDGTLWTTEGGIQSFTHATLGAKSGTTLVSINDGSQNALADWQPVLGAGNFNATVQVLPPKSTGVTVTNITGYSDGATSVEGTPTCGFHAVVSYTADKKKLKGAGVWTGMLDNGTSIGMTADPIAASPMTSTNIQVAAADLKLSSGYQFITMIQDSNGDLLAFIFSSPFSLDPTDANWVNGCPPAGELVSTSWGS